MKMKLLNLFISFLPLNSLRRVLRANFFPKISYINNLKIEKKANIINIYKDNKCIRMHIKNEIYVQYDIVNHFDFYFSAVKPIKRGQILLVDYSKKRLHIINEYKLHKVMIPSVMEPISAIEQYIEFFKPNEDSIILDLGSYTGLTSILFDIEICKYNKNANGQVITIEADKNSLKSVKYNLKQYNKKTNRKINYLYGAVWNKNGELEFSAESNLASSVVEVFKRCRGAKIKTPCYNLSSIAKIFKLNQIDFIKCDIEGAEFEMVDDKEFFTKYKPKIIMELHDYDNETKIYDKVSNTLDKYGYTVKKVMQKDSFSLPLLECTPKETNY